MRSALYLIMLGLMAWLSNSTPAKASDHITADDLLNIETIRSQLNTFGGKMLEASTKQASDATCALLDIQPMEIVYISSMNLNILSKISSLMVDESDELSIVTAAQGSAQAIGDTEDQMTKAALNRQHEPPNKLCPDMNLRAKLDLLQMEYLNSINLPIVKLKLRLIVVKSSLHPPNMSTPTRGGQPTQ